MSLKIEKSGIISASGTGINPNLVPNYGIYTKDNPYVWTSSVYDGWKQLSGSNFEVKPNTTYTYSVYCDGVLAENHGGKFGEFSMWLYICNDGNAEKSAQGRYDIARVFLNGKSEQGGQEYVGNFIQIGQRYIWTYTTTSVQKYFSLRINNYGDSNSTLVTNRYWGFKVEEGSIATPWIPNENDENYTGILNAFVESQSNTDINASIKKDYVESNRFIEI